MVLRWLQSQALVLVLANTCLQEAVAPVCTQEKREPLSVPFLLSETSASHGTCSSLLPSSGRGANLYLGNDLSPGALRKNSSVTDLGLSQGPKLLSRQEASGSLRVGCGAGFPAE